MDAEHSLTEQLGPLFSASGFSLALLGSPDGRILAANPGFCSLLAFEPGELLVRNLPELAHPDDVVANQRLVEDLLGGGREQYRLESLLCRKDGSILWARINVAALVLPAVGQRLALVCVEDVSAERRSEEELRLVESRFRHLFEHNLAGMYRARVDGRILECNEAFARLLGYVSPAQLLSGGPQPFGVDDAASEKFLAELHELLALRNFQSARRRRDGSTIAVLENASLVPDRDGRLEVVEGSVLDISDRVRAAELLRAQRDLAQALAGFSSLDEALAHCLKVAIQVSGMTGGAIYLHDEASACLRMVSSQGVEEAFRSAVQEIPLASERGQRLLLGQAHYTAYPMPGVPEAAHAARLGVRAVASLPLCHQGRLVGHLGLASLHFDYVPREVRNALEAIAPQMGNAIVRIRAEEQVRLQRDLAEELSGTSTLEVALPLCLRAALRVSGLDSGSAFLVDEGASRYWLACSEGLTSSFVDAIASGTLDSPRGRLILAGRPLYTRFPIEGVGLPAEALQEKLRAVAVIPLVYQGRPIGCFILSSHLVDEVPEHVREALETIGAQVGNAIVRIRAEEQVRLQRDLAKELAGIATLEAALPLCLRAALTVSGLDSGGIYLVDEAEQSVRLVCTQGLSPAFVEAAAGGRLDSPRGRLFLAGKTVYSRYPTEGVTISPVEAAEGLRSVAVIPLFYHGEPIGCFNLASHVADEVPAHAREALESIGAQVANAIVRIRAEQEVRESQQRLQDLFDSLYDMVLVFGTDGAVLTANPAAQRLLGRPASELVGQQGRTIVAPEDRERSLTLFAEAVRTGLGTADLNLLTKDGRLVPVETVATTGRWGNRDVLIAMSRDISERRAMEERLVHMQRVEAMGRLAGGVAHEFNNVLQSVLGQTALLRRHAGDAKLVRELAEELGATLRRGTYVVRQLMLFSRSADTDPEPTDLFQAIRRALGLLRRLIREGVAFEVEPATERLGALIDRSHLDQLIWNLVLNAVEAMPDGGTLTVRAGGTERQVFFSVSDTGPGLPADVNTAVFEPFVVPEKGITSGGLGLAVAHSIVTQAGGHIEAESVPGRGSTFRVVLPRVELGEAASADTALALEVFPASTARVVVVEDDEMTRYTVGRILETLGYQASVLSSGEEALALPAAPELDVLVTDLVLGGISGLDLAERLSERWPALKVIVVSGYSLDEPTRARLLERRWRFLPKPFSDEALRQELARVLEPAQGLAPGSATP
jgi:two-component system, cell cycle sensor histidine kinase and response regulator CckA